ncbi:hypothetical protein L3Y21_gp057 [Gordonia phage Rabbitrun]|uniref:Uncharacterized protein n=1 Tax=Gordonia phage Rabbitrun TaxID=2762280 RepID=A0A7G8LIM8_9CAUD|nr:hypothetical protein L3Y21_gp057 [Gordonia phage Rabbitrun]QNJ57100.1 hypothetical protein SEA_RABBITRUN_57 [Gordonia phage Rabbitrun]
MKIRDHEGQLLAEARRSPGGGFIVLSVPVYSPRSADAPARTWLTVAESKKLRKALKKAEKKVKP